MRISLIKKVLHVILWDRHLIRPYGAPSPQREGMTSQSQPAAVPAPLKGEPRLPRVYRNPLASPSRGGAPEGGGEVPRHASLLEGGGSAKPRRREWEVPSEARRRGSPSDGEEYPTSFCEEPKGLRMIIKRFMHSCNQTNPSGFAPPFSILNLPENGGRSPKRPPFLFALFTVPPACGPYTRSS